MTINPRSSQKARPTKGTITGQPVSGDRAQRRSALMAKAVFAALPITACLLLLRALPHESSPAVSQPVSQGTSLSGETGHHPSRSRSAAAPFAEEIVSGSSFDGLPSEPDSATPETPQQRHVAELAAFYAAASHPDDRASLAAELAVIPSPDAVRQLLKLLESESDPLARRDLLYALATADGRQEAAPEFARSLQSIHASSPDPQERGLIQEVLSEAPTPESVAFLRTQAAREEIDPYERLSAYEGLMRISAIAPELMGGNEIQALQERLRAEAQASEGEPEYQAQALMALGGRKEENQEFFRQMQESAEDPSVRQLLAKLGR